MKSLKNTVALICLLLLAAFSSCKKDNTTTPATEDDGSFLKEYYITGKYIDSYNSQDIQLPYIIQFSENAKVIITSGYITTEGNYTYKDGVLTLIWATSSKDVFNVTNKTLSGHSGSTTFATYSLQKTPDANQLSGNTYSGSSKTPGSSLFTFGSYKFNDSQYGVASFGTPVINTDYTLINNVAATSNTGGNGKITFFMLIDGKLEIASYNPTNANGAITVSYGSYTKK